MPTILRKYLQDEHEDRMSRERPADMVDVDYLKSVRFTPPENGVCYIAKNQVVTNQLQFHCLINRFSENLYLGDLILLDNIHDNKMLKEIKDNQCYMVHEDEDFTRKVDCVIKTLQRTTILPHDYKIKAIYSKLKRVYFNKSDIKGPGRYRLTCRMQLLRNFKTDKYVLKVKYYLV